MKRLLLFVACVVTWVYSFSGINSRDALGYICPSMYDTDTCILSSFSRDNLDCDNLFVLISLTGDIIDDIEQYKIPNGFESYGYQGMLCFYRAICKEPGNFAKSIMRDYLFEEIPYIPSYRFVKSMLKTTPEYYIERSYLRLAWAYLWGDIVPQDTLLGKEVFAFLTGTPMDSLENFILPFWRDSIYRQYYLNKQQTFMRDYLKDKPLTPLVRRVIDGDTMAYKEIMKFDEEGENLIYAIYMIDQFNYKPAYNDLYICMEHKNLNYENEIGKNRNDAWLFRVLSYDKENVKNLLDYYFKNVKVPPPHKIEGEIITFGAINIENTCVIHYSTK